MSNLWDLDVSGVECACLSCISSCLARTGAITSDKSSDVHVHPSYKHVMMVMFIHDTKNWSLVESFTTLTEECL